MSATSRLASRPKIMSGSRPRGEFRRLTGPASARYPQHQAFAAAPLPGPILPDRVMPYFDPALAKEESGRFENEHSAELVKALREKTGVAS